MNAVIYCRVSTREQVDNLSLATQESACRDFCDRAGLRVVEVFVERGESAKTVDRTELGRLLDYCSRRTNDVDAVVVYNLSRFARDNHDHHALRALLAKNGVSLRSVTEPIGDSSSGRLLEGVLAAFAQFDNDQRSERTTTGMRAALERGRWTFSAPLGYRKPERGKGGRAWSRIRRLSISSDRLSS